MTFLHIIATHLAPEHVERHLRFLEFVNPGIPRLLAYGGPFSEFGSLAPRPAIFLEDESLRGPMPSQSFNELPVKLCTYLQERGTSFDFFHFSEYDHIILASDYFQRLETILVESRCDFIGHGCSLRTNSNWPHLFGARTNKSLLQLLKRVSVREDKTQIAGFTLNGYTLSAAVFRSIAEIPDLPRMFSEALFPTLAYHLGFRIGDVGAYSDLFRYVRYRPVWTKTEVAAMIRKGAPCCHPFKDTDYFDEIERLVGT